MLIPTLQYFFTQSPCKLRQVSHGGTSFCMPSSQKVAARPCTACLLSCGHSSHSRRPKQGFCNLEIVNRMFSRIFAFTSPFISSVTKDGHPLRSSSCILVLPSFEQPKPFPHTPLVRCTFTLHFNNLPVNFRRTNIFSV